MSNHFKIIVPFYNVEEWVKICIRSAKLQSYKNFQCVLVDDISTDRSAEIVKQEIAGDDRFVLVQNTEKAYALKNIYDAINLSEPHEEDVIVTLDGDDWLASKDVLDKLNAVYTQSDCWLTYGSYAEYPRGSRGKFAKQIPEHVVKNATYRSSEWCSSHLRTFKYHLWSKIEKKDLLDNDGNFYKMAWDLAFMFPMLEMAGDKSKYIKDVLYIYNLGNPLNDHKVDNQYQLVLEKQIRAKEKYAGELVVPTILGPSPKNSGLGNQLFCIATAISYAAEHKKRFVLPFEIYGHEVRKYRKNLYTNLSVTALGLLAASRAYREKSFQYTKIPHMTGTIVLNGYYQSEKYFSDHRDEVLKQLNISSLKREVVEQYGDYSDHASIHVRRGDYLDLPEHHPVLGVSYYEEAVSKLPSGQKFLIFSDDIEWCKGNITFLKDAEFSPCSHDYEDMLLMSTCRDNIIANSTFSWWSAWLNINKNKRVIAPNTWFGPAIDKDISDLIPDTWEVI